MNYLAEHFSLGSPVVEPVRSINGRLVEEGVSTEGERHLVTVTRVAPGRTHESLARDTISDDLFFEIGRSLAVLHCNLMLIDGRSYGFPEQSRFATLTTPAKGSLPWTRRWSCLTSA
jgi:Ser/Thr protein kinase RdoA (MazF antagonist)